MPIKQEYWAVWCFSTWARLGMKWALTNGIISGDGAGYLRPKKSATRAEGAAMLLRMNNWL